MESEELKYEEFEALKAIYSDELILSPNSVSVKLSSPNDTKQLFTVTLQFDLPPRLYPLVEGPKNIAISAPWMSSGEKQTILELLSKQVEENLGQSMIYTLVECARIELESLIDSKLEQESQRNESNNTELSSPEVIFNIQAPEIYHGELIQDRKSTFQGHLARVNSVDEVMKTIEKLKLIKKISLATHNMWAYRIVENDTQIVREDCDDDGETHAGSRLLHLLNIVDAKGVLVIVSRWYGGIQLGPDRFKHINNAARDVLSSNGCINK